MTAYTLCFKDSSRKVLEPAYLANFLERRKRMHRTIFIGSTFEDARLFFCWQFSYILLFSNKAVVEQILVLVFHTNTKCQFVS